MYSIFNKNWSRLASSSGDLHDDGRDDRIDNNNRRNRSIIDRSNVPWWRRAGAAAAGWGWSLRYDRPSLNNSPARYTDRSNGGQEEATTTSTAEEEHNSNNGALSWKWLPPVDEADEDDDDESWEKIESWYHIDFWPIVWKVLTKWH